MNTLIDAAIARYRTVFMILAFIVFAGSISYVTVPKESSPDVQIPIIYVSMTLEGVSPEDAERLLIRPMEKKLQSVEGIKDMKSEATLGFASVILEFYAGFDSEKALADVRAQVDEAKPELPEDADEPVVNEVNFSQFPVLNIILTGDVSERVLVKIARDLRDKIEGIPNVLEAKLSGDREEVLDIIIDPLAIEGYNISPVDVLQRVDVNNVLIAAGNLDTGKGRYNIKVPGLIEGYDDLRKVVLINTDDAVVTLEDISEIRRTFKDPESFGHIHGKRAIGIAVSKRAGANIIDTVAAVKKLVHTEQQYWPSEVKLVFSQDNSDQIIDMLSDLENNVLLAVLLVMVVVMLTLGLRSAGLVAFAIPGSFLIGILVISTLGFTLNIVVLFSLILSVGMLVDSAIVVTEYADRLMEKGVSPRQAYGEGAKRMAWPIAASTLTTLVVFMPLLFWPGVVGQFMKYMPITLLATLSGSLIMAMVFLPTIGTVLARYMRSRSDLQAMADDKAEFNELTERYARLLVKILERPWRFVFGLTGVVVFLMTAFVTVGPGVEFFPKIEPNNANLLVRARGNLATLEKDALMRQVEQRLAGYEHEIKVMYIQSGKVSLRDLPEDVVGVVQMEFSHWSQRRKADVILAEMVEKTNDIPGIIVETAQQEEGPPTGKAIQLELRSRIPDKLLPAAAHILAGMEQMGGFVNQADERPIPEIEWEYVVNREQAGQNNISMRDVGNMIKLVSRGIKINEYRPDDADDEVDIVVRFPEDARNLSQMERLRVYTPDGLVPLANFITREPRQSSGTIRRVDGQRVINIRADLEPGILPDDRVKEMTEWLKNNPVDPQVQIRFRGEDEEQKEAGQFLSGAFATALFLMALILTTQFNSIYYMFVIMSAVFFSTGGVLLGLLISYEPFGIVMCGVGIISLAGIVVNNNIIFIDTYKQILAEGYRVQQALVLTGKDRLRPILLTAGTTVLGLLPMVFGMNIDFFGRDISFGAPSSQWWTQLSTAIAGGLTFATILTLFFTPCLIYLRERPKA